MLDFTKYMMRYGEHGVQAIVEDIEQHQGIKYTAAASLEDRWNTVMQNDQFYRPRAA